MELKKIKIGLALSAGLFLSAACSPGFSTSTSGAVANVASTTLAVTPNSQSVAPFATLQLTASGGTSPYTYSIASGSGTVGASTGLFIAPSVAGETDLVQVTDATGASVDASLLISISGSSTSTGSTVTSGTLTVSYSPSVVYTGDSVAIIAAGTPPYTYTLTTGSGVLSGNYYTAASTAESVVIVVTDSANNSAVISFNVTVGVAASAPAVSVMAISFVPPQTTQNQCPNGGVLVGTTGAMYGGSLNKYAGDSTYCETTGTTQGASQVLADMTITPMGQHQSNPVCPGGYAQLTKVQDCGGGKCSGYQSICVLQIDPMTATTFISDFYITTENVHANATCSSGYTSIGSTADCGGGSCVGTQAFCVKH